MKTRRTIDIVRREFGHDLFLCSCGSWERAVNTWIDLVAEEYPDCRIVVREEESETETTEIVR